MYENQNNIHILKITAHMQCSATDTTKYLNTDTVYFQLLCKLYTLHKEFSDFHFIQ